MSAVHVRRIFKVQNTISEWLMHKNCTDGPVPVRKVANILGRITFCISMSTAIGHISQIIQEI